LTLLGVLDPAQVRTFDVYRAGRPSATRPAAATQRWSLRLNKPQASEALNRPNIAVIPQGDVISSYKARAGAIRRRCWCAIGCSMVSRDGRDAAEHRRQQLQADTKLGGSCRRFRPSIRATRPAWWCVDALLVRGYDQKILASRL
jgi:cholesterol transport system auxiliary component